MAQQLSLEYITEQLVELQRSIQGHLQQFEQFLEFLKSEQITKFCPRLWDAFRAACLEFDMLDDPRVRTVKLRLKNAELAGTS